MLKPTCQLMAENPKRSAAYGYAWAPWQARRLHKILTKLYAKRLQLSQNEQLSRKLQHAAHS